MTGIKNEQVCFCDPVKCDTAPAAFFFLFFFNQSQAQTGLSRSETGRHCDPPSAHLHLVLHSHTLLTKTFVRDRRIKNAVFI